MLKSQVFLLFFSVSQETYLALSSLTQNSVKYEFQQLVNWSFLESKLQLPGPTKSHNAAAEHRPLRPSYMRSEKGLLTKIIAISITEEKLLLSGLIKTLVLITLQLRRISNCLLSHCG